MLDSGCGGLCVYWILCLRASVLDSVRVALLLSVIVSECAWIEFPMCKCVLPLRLCGEVCVGGCIKVCVWVY